MKKQQSSIDGFVPRRAGSTLGELHNVKNPQSRVAPIDRSLHTGDNHATTLIGSERPQKAIGRVDIDESLQQIDEEVPAKKPSRRARRKEKRKDRRPRHKGLRIAKWVVIAIIAIAVLIGGYVALKAFLATHSVFQGNVFDILTKNEPLKEDENGRSNFLLLGTSEDDPNHPGGNLTDSMMIVSIDQDAKNAFMVSIPRDLYVEYNQACVSGYQGKINVYFSCANEGTEPADEQDRLTKTQALVGEIFGLDIQYGVHVNNTVIKDAVDAVGGIDVDIQGSNGAPGILDRNFDWRCNYQCHYVKYDNGVHRLDGERALFLSMARGDVAPTYGLANSNFDREKNQQKIIVALKEKATSTGTLTNVGAVTSLIDSFGDNLRTNIQTNEIRTLMDIAATMKSEDIVSISLFGTDDAVVTSGPYNGQSVVMPVAGIFEYSGIQAFIDKNFSSDPIVREGANITVFNGSGGVGVARTFADKLIAQGFTVDDVADAPDGTYEDVEVYALNDENPKTTEKLESLYKVTVKTTAPPVSVTGETDFVIIVGKAPETSN